MATHHDTPSIRTPHPCGTGRALALRQFATLDFAALNHQCTFRRVAHTDAPPPDPDMSKVTTCAANADPHAPCLCQADDADQYRVIVAAPGQPSAGLASHLPNVAPR